jgi:predicted Zn-dependent peptidase
MPALDQHGACVRAGLLSEEVPGMHSVLLGVGLGVGSRDDGRGQTGMAHLCEHLRVASANARLGEAKLSRISLEAFTEREETFFVVQALREDRAILLEWLDHLVSGPELLHEQFEREREVVVEEALTLASSAIDRVDGAFMAEGYSGTAYARPIAGVPEELVSIEQDAALAFIDRHRRGARRVVAVVGDLRGTELAEQIAGKLGDPGPRPAAPPAASTVELRPGSLEVPAGLEARYFVLGVPAVCRASEHRVPLYALSAHLGDGFNSQLFLELRQRRALVYSVRTEYYLFRDAGHLVIKGVASPEKLPEVLARVAQIVERMRSWVPEPGRVAELQRALARTLLINLDEPRNKLLRLLKHELWFSTFFTVEDDLASVERLTPDVLSAIARGVLGRSSLLCQGT